MWVYCVHACILTCRGGVRVWGTQVSVGLSRPLRLRWHSGWHYKRFMQCSLKQGVNHHKHQKWHSLTHHTHTQNLPPLTGRGESERDCGWESECGSVCGEGGLEWPGSEGRGCVGGLLCDWCAEYPPLTDRGLLLSVGGRVWPLPEGRGLGEELEGPGLFARLGRVDTAPPLSPLPETPISLSLALWGRGMYLPSLKQRYSQQRSSVYQGERLDEMVIKRKKDCFEPAPSTGEPWTISSSFSSITFSVPKHSAVFVFLGSSLIILQRRPVAILQTALNLTSQSGGSSFSLSEALRAAPLQRNPKKIGNRTWCLLDFFKQDLFLNLI